jgi:hypothetical protein
VHLPLCVPPSSINTCAVERILLFLQYEFNYLNIKATWKLKLKYSFLKNYVGYEVLAAVSTKMAVFWVVAPCSLVEVYQRFRRICCLHHQDECPDDEGNKDL